MKGFRNTSKGRSGFHFSTENGFSDSSGKVRTVKSYSRRVPKFAEGGSVDSSVIKRTVPMTQFDAEHGGKGPLRPGFKKGGKIGPVKKGALHQAMGIPQGEKIGVGKLEKAKKSSSPLMRKRANFALNARKWGHSKEPLIGS